MKKVISLLLCIVLVSGCGKQPAGELAPTNVLPSSVTNNYNYYKLIEFNGDSFDRLAELWSKIPQKVKYGIYGVSAFVVLLFSAHGLFSFLARIGVVTDYHRATGITKLTDAVGDVKNELNELNKLLTDIPTHMNKIATSQNLIAQGTAKAASALTIINAKTPMPLNMRPLPPHMQPRSSTPPPSAPPPPPEPPSE
ncbi:hypothetical protein [Candidatus Endomicrobiellum agilis]|uniref:hypothetical protein n=1 Tax=Candidatus Endomicrobiellum agilis TaxID=3238957 RepID=UPI0035751BB8|nr:hypothetical protein [Endomicrobium sp.]